MLLNTCNISVKYHWVFVNGLKRKKERKEGRKDRKREERKKRERKKKGKKEIFWVWSQIQKQQYRNLM